MKRTEKTDKAANEYAVTKGFDSAEYLCEYKDKVAYSAKSKALENTYYGYPNFVFVENGMYCRLATNTEANQMFKQLTK